MNTVTPNDIADLATWLARHEWLPEVRVLSASVCAHDPPRVHIDCAREALPWPDAWRLASYCQQGIPPHQVCPVWRATVEGVQLTWIGPVAEGAQGPECGLAGYYRSGT